MTIDQVRDAGRALIRVDIQVGLPCLTWLLSSSVDQIFHPFPLSKRQVQVWIRPAFQLTSTGSAGVSVFSVSDSLL